MNKEILKKAFRLFFLLCFVNAVGYVGGGFVTPDRINWLYGLNLPPLMPPAIVFGLVWPILYLCIAISAFLVWGKTSPRNFALQLAFNGVWPFAFFYLHSPIGGLIVILLLLIFLVLTIKQFYPVSKSAAFLLIPYLIWVVFASYLNGYIALFN